MTDPLSSALQLVGSLTEPITKLIETVGSGIGTLYEPTRILRRAKGEARAAKVKAESDVEVARIKAEGDWELVERTNERLAAKELRRQNNIESIVAKAVPQLPESVSREPVDADWTVQFFNYAQDIGNEEMQLIWAGILAGEVNQPGTYSLRTLHTLRMLGTDDARRFRNLCPYSWRIPRDLSGYMGGTEANEYLQTKGLRFDDFLLLDSVGLVLARGREIGIIISPGNPQEVEYMGKHLILSMQSYRTEVRTCPFTDVGLELARLVDAEPDWDYYDIVVNAWRKAGIIVESVETTD